MSKINEVNLGDIQITESDSRSSFTYNLQFRTEYGKPETKVYFVSTTGSKFTTGVDQDGVYEISLPLGIYKIDFIRTGYKTLTVAKYQIVATDSGIMYLDVVLERNKP